ncbi:MAG: tripartite tricarboxylate transporter substrate binding protein [Lautropia sp.]
MHTPDPGRRLVALALLAAVSAAPALAAHAADAWPSKPITIVAPFGPGSGTDVTSRLYAKFITEETGATVVVENRPGANAMIGSALVAKAAPDGYTVLMGSGTANAANYALYADRITYRPEQFSAVSVVFVTPPVIFAAPQVKGATVGEALASAKASAKGASCGTGNAVTLVACSLLSKLGRTDLVPVSYKGNAQSLTDLAGDQITLAISDMGAASTFVQSGRVRPVAVAAKSRLDALPGIPAAPEQGFDMDFLSWNAVFVPAGTPEPIVRRLNAAARRMITSPEGQKLRVSSAGLPVSGDLDDARRFVADEIAKWTKYVRETGVKVE